MSSDSRPYACKVSLLWHLYVKGLSRSSVRCCVQVTSAIKENAEFGLVVTARPRRGDKIDPLIRT